MVSEEGTRGMGMSSLMRAKSFMESRIRTDVRVIFKGAEQVAVSTTCTMPKHPPHKKVNIYHPPNANTSNVAGFWMIGIFAVWTLGLI